MKLLTLNQAKMLKGRSRGYLSAILNLQPSYKYKQHNTCPHAGQCRSLCLAQTGRNRFDGANKARLRKTHLYYDNPDLFYTYLIADIEALIRKASRENLIPTIRLNGLSDIPWEKDNIHQTNKNIFDLFPDLTFLDYTKNIDRMGLNIPNYTLCYSCSEKSDLKQTESILRQGKLVSVVFSPEIPQEWNKYPVLPGDTHDLLHLHPPGTVLGLKFKKPFHPKTGKQIKIKPKTNTFVQIGE